MENSTKKEDALLAFIHEIVNNYMPILNKSASLISKATENKKVDFNTLEYNIRTILETLELLNTNMKILNIEINPEFFTFQQIQPVNIHGSFLRCSKLLKYKARDKNIYFKFDTNGEKNIPEILSIPIVTAIPYILFDNCIKYCPSSGAVDVSFQKDKNKLHVTVSSMGPEVRKEELDYLTQKGFRGENAIKSNIDGKGIGLYYLEKICNYGNINVKFISSNSKTLIDNINYSYFEVELEFSF